MMEFLQALLVMIIITPLVPILVYIIAKPIWKIFEWLFGPFGP